MSSINPHFTFHYSQPPEYSFSHDSVFLAREVFEWCRRESFQPRQALDLCAGCGIVGLDFLFHLRQGKLPLPARFDFVEVQEIYREHFFINRERLGSLETLTKFIAKNYADIEAQAYDLVLCNPPYFRPEQGTLSPSDFKNRCRFFIDSDFPHLMKSLGHNLSPLGKAFVLLRDLGDHGWNPLIEAQEILGDEFILQKIADVRGTDLILIRHKVPR